MNLFQTNALAIFENFIDMETGEVDLDGFNQSKLILADKQLAVLAHIKNESGRIGLLSGAIKELQTREKSMLARQDWLKDYLLVNMQAHSITRLEAIDLSFVATLQNNPPSVVIDDLDAIPADYMRTPPAPPPAPDKRAILEALKSGVHIHGARLVSSQRIVIK
jgi:hypothetical protein